jgi:hypothetical protein
MDSKFGQRTRCGKTIKDISTITEDDAIHDEWKLEKELPGNQFAHIKKAALRAADYDGLVAGDGFEPPTFGL